MFRFVIVVLGAATWWLLNGGKNKFDTEMSRSSDFDL